MTLIRLLLLALISQIRGCFVPLCDAVRGYEPQTVSTRAGDRVLVGAARVNDGDLIADMARYYLPPEYHHTVVRVDETYGPQELAKFKLADFFGSGVVASGDKWWYSLAGGRDEKVSGVYFLTPEETFVDVGPVFTGDWLPFDEPEPRGLLIGHERDRLLAMEITPGGVRRRWTLPMENVWAAGARDAERLPGGAIALVSLLDDRNALQLFMLDGEEPVIVPLRENLSHVRLTTALSSDGMLAVVLESKNGDLEAAVLDPRNPGEPRWQLLTSKEEPGRYARVVFHDGKFIAAWFATQTNELRARTFTAQRPGPSATIASLYRRGNRLPAIEILPDGEELLFVWQDDEVMARRIPVEPGGFWLMEQLCKRWF